MKIRTNRAFKGDSNKKRSIILIFSCLLLLIFGGCSKQKPLPENIYNVDEAVKLRETGRYDSSIAVYRFLVKQLDSSKDCSIFNKYRLEITDLLRLSGKFVSARNLLDEIDTVNCTDKYNKFEYFLVAGKLDYDTRNYISALAKFEEALIIGNNIYGENSSQCAECFSSIGKCYLSLNNYPEAKKYFDLSYAIKIDKIISGKKLLIADFINYGLYYLALGEYDLSLKNFNSALNLIPNVPDKTILERYNVFALDSASILNGIGIVNYQMSEFEESLKNLNAALRIRERILTRSHYLTADIYGNIGMVYVAYAEPEIASDLYEKALNTRIKVFGEKSIIVARTYNNLGNVFKDMGKYDKAESYFLNAINILDALSPGNVDLGITLGNLGDTEAHNKNFNESIRHFLESIDILKKYFGVYHPYTALTIDNLGLAYAGMGNYGNAVKYHNLAYNIAIKVFPSKSNILVSQILDELGNIKAVQGDYYAALKLYQKSLSNLFPSIDENNFEDNPVEGDLKRDMVSLETLSSKANTLFELFRKTGDKSLIELSMRTYHLVDKTIDKIRSGFKEESSKLLLSKETFRIFYNAIRTYAAASDIEGTQSKQLMVNKAFSFCEKSKALNLLETLIDIKAKDFGGIPDSLLQKEHNLQYRISLLEASLDEEQNLGNDADKSKLNAFRNSIFDLKKQYYSLMDNFEKNFPKYYSLKYKLDPVNVDSIRNKILKEKEVLLEYFIGDEQLFIFTISKTDFVLTTVKTEESIGELVNKFREGLRENNYVEYSLSSYKLYQAIIKPVGKFIDGKNLVIIPDGPLNYIPFDALITLPPEPNKVDYRMLHYLIYDHKISYGYSASLLWENIVRDRSKEPNSFVGFAPY
jgi:tetratricopeptide (TPR) repeat protein